ncbi:signal peptidase I [Streptomyces sp. H10-C2]|uniref:signal peptidase I n=1 Tax=unclassified Streptomyces TaxID=2593676 RepID=UPI0024BB8EA9|nr:MULTISPECIES: signal peptidase I [unclassified Streptomyces]MDJ0341729.1 signal peptidase I [Streptomyces sp. PH10-H1]MDJ0368963.1 signal peptidase I [Streptomyces sp. H10-C2]
MGNRGKPRYGHHRPAAGVDAGASTGTAPGPGSVSGTRAGHGPAEGYGYGTADGSAQGPAGGSGHGPAGGSAPRTGGSRADRRKLARKVKRKRRRSAAREVPLLLVVALLIALVLKTFLLQAFVIPSGSMEQTIRIGDRVLVDKLTPWFGSQPQRGDVVVFKDPGGWLANEPKPKPDPVVVKQVKEFFTFIGLLPASGEQDLIKRVIAVGGDTVKCCDRDGRITVNGTPLIEPYLNPGNPPSQLKFTVTVPAGRVWVMGDHRSDSADSRYHMDQPGQGTVPLDLVVGRAFVIAWPLGHWRKLEEPGTYASVPDAHVAGTNALGLPAKVGTANNGQGTNHPPTPAELPLVMGVVGLRQSWRGRQRGMRSERGGPGGRRTIRIRRARGRGRPGGLCPADGGRRPGPRTGA